VGSRTGQPTKSGIAPWRIATIAVICMRRFFTSWGWTTKRWRSLVDKLRRQGFSDAEIRRLIEAQLDRELEKVR